MARVVAHKCAQHNETLGNIAIASRSVAKCDDIVASVLDKGSMKVQGSIKAYALDAMDVARNNFV